MMKNHFLRTLARDQRGATAIEYGLIIAMIFLAMLGAVVALGSEDKSLYEQISSTAVGAMKGSS